MINPFKRSGSKGKFDRKVLRKNDISLLTLDERWNNLFVSNPRTPDIIKNEEKLRELLKEQARLITESKENASLKKKAMDKIISLTTKAYDEDNADAKNEMQACEKEIHRINDRAEKIREELEEVPERIRETNLELLGSTVNVVYYKIRKNQKRVKELEKIIEETRAKLKEYIDEKEVLSQDDTDVYSYFHDLLGAEELEKLDREFFG